jgi:DNA-binding response OmpR family regulator
MNMPDGEGNYIFGRFKSHPLTKDIPILVLTGQENPGLRRLMLSLGADAYLQKPVDLGELLSHLRRHIDLPARATDELERHPAAAGELVKEHA